MNFYGLAWYDEDRQAQMYNTYLEKQSLLNPEQKKRHKKCSMIALQMNFFKKKSVLFSTRNLSMYCDKIQHFELIVID